MTRGLGGQSPANISHHLKGIGFPAHKQDLIRQARRNGADADVIDMIERLPEAEYGDMAGVMKAYGKADEEIDRGDTGSRQDGRKRH